MQMDFLVKTKRIVKILFRNYVWEIKTHRKVVYLTFDDGPTPQITDWVLQQLDKHNAKATFFCIGNNIHNNPEIFRKVINAGHSIGNHTQNHVNGWHIADEVYDANVSECDSEIRKFEIESKLFRPPYGKLTWSQSKNLKSKGYKIIMWDILSADFDHNITPEKCLDNVLKNVVPGSIIIFNDSVQAFGNLEYVLPKTLQYLKEKEYECKAIA